MAKNRTEYYECNACGEQQAKWSGQCPECGKWNTMELVKAVPGAVSTLSGAGKRISPGLSKSAPTAKPRPLSEIALREDARLPSHIGELDRVLGGGILIGSSVLLGGEPGIGKSTLMLQAASAYAAQGTVLYISGEEAAEQIKMRAKRLAIDSSNILIHNGSLAEECAQQIMSVKPRVVIIDSVQTLMTADSGAGPGSPNQVKLSVQLISDACRAVQSSSFFIAHVTKDGSIAGPKQVEHLVDAVLYFDHSNHELRFLRASKNRFGSSDEVGLFSMDETGLREVKDPGNLFLSEVDGDVPAGTAIVPVYEGSRILMVEIQALTVPGRAGFGRVYSDRIDQRRVSRVAAVIEKHLGLKLSDQDIYVNVAGGIRLSDVGIELALAMAIYSARTGIALPAKASLCGEISLSGRVRSVSHLARRQAQAEDLGYSPIVQPRQKNSKKNTRLQEAGNLSDAVKALFKGKAGEAQ